MIVCAELRADQLDTATTPRANTASPLAERAEPIFRACERRLQHLVKRHCAVHYISVPTESAEQLTRMRFAFCFVDRDLGGPEAGDGEDFAKHSAAFSPGRASRTINSRTKSQQKKNWQVMKDELFAFLCGYDEFRKRTTLVAVTFRFERKLRDIFSYLLYKRRRREANEKQNLDL
jgi:hypothetical protein